jgi:hypothetical protein
MPDVFKHDFAANIYVNEDGKKVFIINAIPTWLAVILGEGLDYKVQDPITEFDPENAWRSVNIILTEDDGALLSTPLVLEEPTGANGETLS